MDYDYFDHEADIGVRGKGKTLTEAFINAAQAVFAIMTNTEKLTTHDCVTISFDEEDREIALVIWLNQLISQALTKQLIFKHFELQQKGNHWVGKACGQKWNTQLIPGTEVKGATLTALAVKNLNDHWIAQCVVDV